MGLFQRLFQRTGTEFPTFSVFLSKVPFLANAIPIYHQQTQRGGRGGRCAPGTLWPCAAGRAGLGQPTQFANGSSRCERQPRISGAGRVASSVAAAPAQEWVQLWTLDALPPNTSKAGTLAQSQRYCARGRCACPCCRVWSVCRWQRYATTLVHIRFS